MAARFLTKRFVLTGSVVSLESILNSAPDTFVSGLTVRAGKSNVADVSWYDAGGTEVGGYLEPREAASFDLTGKFIRTSDVKFNGTAGDVINITVLS